MCGIAGMVAPGYPTKPLQAWKSMYGRTSQFKDLFPQLEAIYALEHWKTLVDFNLALIQHTCVLLGIRTPLKLSSDLHVPEERNCRLVTICQFLGAHTYLHGKGTHEHLDNEVFQQHGVKPLLAQFQHPVYPQPWGPFVAGLSIWDVLLNCGIETTQKWLHS